MWIRVEVCDNQYSPLDYRMPGNELRIAVYTGNKQYNIVKQLTHDPMNSWFDRMIQEAVVELKNAFKEKENVPVKTKENLVEELKKVIEEHYDDSPILRDLEEIVGDYDE